MDFGVNNFTALILLFVLWPVFLIVSILNFIITKGEPFFFQKRIGKNNSPFYIIKFRSMKKDVKGHWNTKKNDNRITFFGKFLRKTSIDEIPQLFNIILGDMNFIGPRPDLPNQIRILKKKDRILRLSVKPGITGLAQVSGRSNLSYLQRLYYDLFYVKNKSLFLDIAIIFFTFITLFSKNSN